MLEQFEAEGYVDDAGFHLDNLERFRDAARQFKRGRVVFSMKAAGKQTRSQRANRYYWGQVLTPMSKEGSEGDQTPEEIHDAMCSMFLPDERKRVEFFNRMTGEQMEVEIDPRRTSKLSGDEFYTFVEQVRKFAAEFMGVVTEDPDPNYWRKRARKGQAA